MKRAVNLKSILLFALAAHGAACGELIADPADSDNDNSSDETETDADTASEGEQDTGVSPTEECPDIGVGDGHFTTQYASGTIKVEGSDKTYNIHTNWWYKFDGQTVDYDGLSFLVGNPNDVDVGSVGAPAGYPSIFIGSYSGRASKDSNLPIAVTEIKSVPTSFHTNAASTGLANRNAAYDVWLTESGDPLPGDQYTPGTGGAYLMVWLFKPEDRQPRGTNAHPAQTIEGVSGTWDVWVDPSDPPCISYVSTEPIDGLDFDLNKFIQDSVTNDYGITEEMYLSIVFAGFEIWGQGDGLSLDRFCAQVN